MTHKMELWSHIDKQAVVKLQLTYLRTFQRAYLDLGKYLDDIQGTQNDRRTIDYKLREVEYTLEDEAQPLCPTRGLQLYKWASRKTSTTPSIEKHFGLVAACL